MKKSKIITLLFSAAAALSISATAHAQAILDIDRAAKELNIESNIEAVFRTMSEELEPELVEQQQKIRADMENMTRLVGVNPNTEQRQRLAGELQLLEAKFNQSRQAAFQKIAAKRTEMVEEFTEKLRPIALAEAKNIKKDVIVLKSNAFHFEPAADITEATIKAAIKAGLKMEAPPEPEEKATEETASE